jgi:hypothetical protein
VKKYRRVERMVEEASGMSTWGNKGKEERRKERKKEREYGSRAQRRGSEVLTRKSSRV